ncbi:hypothetical protein HQ520_03360 [bacterium]|nr:hypothetical protein [bacterium]
MSPPSTQDRPRSKVRTYLFRALAVVVGLALPLLLIEGALRILWRAPLLQFAPDSIRNDPHTSVALVADYDGVHHTPEFQVHHSTNSHGLRDVEHSYEKLANTWRILAIGDSYVQGHGVEYDEMFLTLAERQMAPPDGFEDVEIVKAGVGGWGPENEYEYLVNEGYRYRPDLVVVVFYTGNDYWDAGFPRHFGVWRGMRVSRRRLEEGRWSDRTGALLRKHVYLYGPVANMAGSWFRSPEDRIRQDLVLLETCMPGGPALPTEATRESFRKFKEWSENHDTDLLVLILPHRIQLETDRAREVAERSDLEMDILDLDKPSRVIRGILEEIGIPFLDLTEPLGSYVREHGSLSFVSDTHYTSEGHAATARLFVEGLELRVRD